MKFVIDARPLLEAHPSGVARYTHQLIKHLVAKESEHEYVLFYNASKKCEAIESFAEYKNVSIHALHFPNKLFNGSQFVLRFPHLDKLVRGADLFFAPNHGFVQVSGKIPVVVTAHDISYKLYPEFLSAKGRLWHSIVKPEEFFQQANHIIAVSEHTKNDISSTFGISQKRISVVYCGVNHDLANDKDAGEEKKILEDLPKRYVLSVGTLEPRKNIQGLIQAFARLKEFPNIQSSWNDLALVIVGANGYGSEKLRKGNRKDVFFLNYQNESTRKILYKNALLLAYPSFYEGFGFPPLEAAMQGTPSMVSNVASLPEVMRDSAVFVDPYNSEDMARAMNALVADKLFRKKIQEKARKRAENFHWNDTARQTLKIWEDVVRRSIIE